MKMHRRTEEDLDKKKDRAETSTKERDRFEKSQKEADHKEKKKKDKKKKKKRDESGNESENHFCSGNLYEGEVKLIFTLTIPWQSGGGSFDGLVIYLLMWLAKPALLPSLIVSGPPPEKKPGRPDTVTSRAEVA